MNVLTHREKGAGRYDRLLRLGMLAVCLGLLAVILARHENTRDEAQAWLLARDLGLSGLVRQMAYEGHPCLWHLLLMPLAKTGMPYISMNILSIGMTLIAVALLFRKSNLPLPILATAVFSAPFLYYLPIFSRNYCLIAPVLFMNACLYPDRRSRPLLYGLSIALLVQTHIMMLGMAGVLSLIWLMEALRAYGRDRDGARLMRQGAGLALPLLSLVLLIVQLRGMRASSAFPTGESVRLSSLFQWFMENAAKVGWLAGALVPLFLAAVLVMIALLMRRTAKNPEALKLILTFLLGSVSMLAVLLLAQHINLQKVSVLFPMMLWLVWLLWPMLPTPGARVHLKAVYALACLPMLAIHVFSTVPDVLYSVSDSRNCAEFIQQNVPEEAQIVSLRDPHAAALLPYMKRRTFFSAVRGEPVSYATWETVDRAMGGIEDVKAWMAREHPGDREVVLLTAGKAAELEDHPEVTLMYQTQGALYDSDERYCVYRIAL